MTKEDIVSLIQSSPTLMALVPDTKAIAEEISKGRTKLVRTEIGVGTILEVLGITTGNTLLDVIYSDNNFRHVKPLLEQSRLRLDSPFVISFIDQFVSLGLLTEDQKNALLERAKEPDVISEYEVRVAIFNDDGSMRV